MSNEIPESQRLAELFTGQSSPVVINSGVGRIAWATEWVAEQGFAPLRAMSELGELFTIWGRYLGEW
jgi:hypothetical protein